GGALSGVRRAREDVRPRPCSGRPRSATRGPNLERRRGGGRAHVGRIPGEEGTQNRVGGGPDGALEQRRDLERVRGGGGAPGGSGARRGRRGRQSQDRDADSRGGVSG